MSEQTETEQILNEPLLGVEQQEKPVEEEAKSEETEETTEEPKEEESNEAPEGTEVEQESEKPKKKVSGFTRRLNRERDKNAALEEENRRLREQSAPKQQEQPKTGGPDAEDYDHGINDINYIRDMARHEGKQAYFETKQADQYDTQQQEFQREIQAANFNFEKKLDEAAGKYNDFDDVYDNNSVNLDPNVFYALKKSKIAGDLTYYILKNPKVKAELSKMDAVDGIARIGELTHKLTAKTNGGKTKMPKPIKTVGDGKTKIIREYTNDITDQNDFNEVCPFEDLDTL